MMKRRSVLTLTLGLLALSCSPVLAQTGASQAGSPSLGEQEDIERSEAQIGQDSVGQGEAQVQRDQEREVDQDRSRYRFGSAAEEEDDQLGAVGEDSQERSEDERREKDSLSGMESETDS